MKIIAFYLPQFHNIPENDEWWGDGFTEWTNVKAAKPLFEGHVQPKIPLNNNYYNLLDDNIKIWQANLAKEYGIYGFCYYHYWFSGKMLLEKPMEQMLVNKDVDIPFCISWANEPWTKAWTGENKILIAQNYGDREEWIKHFNYLLPFFKDERYILNDNKPLFVIYRPAVVNCLAEMLDCWNELAKENGFNGIEFAYQSIWERTAPNWNCEKSFRYSIEYQPSLAFNEVHKNQHRFIRSIKNKISILLERNFGISLNNLSHGQLTGQEVEYDTIWKNILEWTPDSSKSIPGAFVKWDNTPRRGERGRVYLGSNPENFEKYISCQIKRAEEIYHSEFLFINAWNEWAEGNYLEPDEEYGYGYLEAIKNALFNGNKY